MQALAPMRRFCPLRRRRSDPYLVVDDFNPTQRHVVGPEIKSRAAPQIETRMVPVAREDAVFDAAAMERKAHMRASVVERDHVVALGHDEYCPAWGAHHHTMPVAQLVERACSNEG